MTYRLTTMFLLAAVLMCAHTAHGAFVTDDPYHYIQEVEVTPYHRVPLLDPAADSDTLFAWLATGKHLQVSGDHGVTWETVWTHTESPEYGFCTPTAIILGFNSGDVYRVARHPYAATLACTTGCTQFRGMAQSDAGNLYMPVYGEPTENCAMIHKSTDDGATWAKVWGESLGHMHFAFNDSYHDAIYAGRGDRQQGGVGCDRIYKSTDEGGTWPIIRAGWRGRVTAMLSLYDRRFFGSDYAEADSGAIFVTLDDSAYTDTLTLAGDYDAVVLAMAMDADSTGFATTACKGNRIAHPIMVRRHRTTGQWLTVKDFGACSSGGVRDITEFDSDGYAYYTLRGDTNHLYRFRDAPVFTVGTGGDFANLTAAIAGTASGDTLIMLPGTHTVTGQTLGGRHLRGPTQNAKDAVLVNGGASAAMITIDATSWIKNLTFQGGGTAFTDQNGRALAVTGALCGKNIRFQNLVGMGDTAREVVLFTTAAERVALEDCRMESCAVPLTGNRNLIFVYNATDVIVRGLISVNNRSGEAGVSIQQTVAKDSALVSGCVFIDNRTKDKGGALEFQPHASSTGSTLVEHITAHNNECLDASDGQIFFSGTSAALRLTHSVITGADSTYAIRNGDVLDYALHVNTWGNLEDHVFASTSSVDTTHMDPCYRWPTATRDGYRASAAGVWHCKDDGYMGWAQYWPRPQDVWRRPWGRR